MTSWLKWRLCALFGTSLLIGGATYLHAQNNYPDPAKTPEQAGTLFFQLLALGNLDSPYSFSSQSWTEMARNERTWPYLGSISRPQMQNASEGTRNGGIGRLLNLLAEEANAPQYDAHTTSTDGNQTIVEIAPATQPKNREVVTIAEDGGYRVDLKATYGRWNNLSGAKLDEAWFGYTGEFSSSLSQNSNFLRSQCQSQMKQQMLGIIQYAQDYDERLPSAREWSDVIQPYVRSAQIFKCPSMPKGGNGYAYNQYFSRIGLAAIDEPALTINVYETSNPNRNWFGPGTGQAYRHMNGWNLAFADGHIKWFSRDNSMGNGTLMLLPNTRIKRQ